MKILIDTSVIIEFLRLNDKKRSLLYKLASNKNQLFVSIVTHTELFSGKSVWENTSAREELNKIFSGIKILPLNEAISTLAGEIRSKNNINIMDAIIAATAIKYKLPLSTLNQKDFVKISKLEIYF